MSVEHGRIRQRIELLRILLQSNCRDVRVQLPRVEIAQPLRVLERVLLEITIGTFCRPTYLPRLARLHILCDERCDFNWIGFLHRCRFVQAEATKELWLKTPVKPVHIKKILEVAEQERVEVYGLKKCAAMYAALPAFDGPKSRYVL